MERVSDKVLEGIINDQGNIIAGSWNAIHYLLVELQARRKAEKEHGHTSHSASEKGGAGATHEREKAINEFWMKIELNCSCGECPASDEDGVCGFWEGTCGASLRKKYESIAGTPPSENAKEAVLPAPVKQVNGVDVKTCTVKQWLAKINEELDELKEEIYVGQARLFRKARIAEEAADTITAITSMLEAMGIDEQARQAAQRRVNEHNRERGRF